MLSRAAFLSALTMALLALAVPAAEAAVDPGPRLTLSSAGAASEGGEIVTLAPSGSEVARIREGSGGDGWRVDPELPLAWSPDGSTLAVSEARGQRRRISLLPVDGGPRRALPSTRGGVLPVFSPDGRRLAFARRKVRLTPEGYHGYESATTWLLDLDSGDERERGAAPLWACATRRGSSGRR